MFGVFYLLMSVRVMRHFGFSSRARFLIDGGDMSSGFYTLIPAMRHLGVRHWRCFSARGHQDQRRV